MAGKWCKKVPDYVYFTGNGEWLQGPYVNKPKGKVHSLQVFKLISISEEEIVPAKKVKKLRK